MNAEKTGKVIFEARMKKGLTQKELAQLICVTDKAVCKWEKGHGCPDITVLHDLSHALGIDIQSLLKGELSASPAHGGNLKKLKLYRCTDCGNLVTATKAIELSCCGKRLEVLPVCNLENSKNSENSMQGGQKKWFEPEVQEFDGQYALKFNHPMTKENYISNFVYVQCDRATVINLFAQQEAQIILPQIRGIKLFAVTSGNKIHEIRL